MILLLGFMLRVYGKIPGPRSLSGRIFQKPFHRLGLPEDVFPEILLEIFARPHIGGYPPERVEEAYKVAGMHREASISESPPFPERDEEG